MKFATAITPDASAIALIPATPTALPPVGLPIHQTIEASRRLGHMRVHMALHLLAAVVPLPVTGGVRAGAQHTDNPGPALARHMDHR